MKVINDVRDFIRTKVNAKVAPVSVEQAFNDAVALVEHFETVLMTNLEHTIQSEFDSFINAHPELEGTELQNPLSGRHRRWISVRNSSISLEYAEAIKLREDYVNEITQRVCIDAVSCKNTEEIIALIDKVIGQ